MKTIKTISFIILVFLFAGCSDNADYWILEEERLSEISEVESHTKKLQEDEHSDSSTFTVFTISEGRKMVVISSGDKAKSLEFSDKESTKKDQKIIVKEVNNKSDHNNPFLLIGLDKVEGNLQVYNESTNEYIIEVDESMNPIN